MKFNGKMWKAQEIEKNVLRNANGCRLIHFTHTIWVYIFPFLPRSFLNVLPLQCYLNNVGIQSSILLLMRIIYSRHWYLFRDELVCVYEFETVKYIKRVHNVHGFNSFSGLSDMKTSCYGCKSCIIMLFTQQKLTISEMVSINSKIEN